MSNAEEKWDKLRAHVAARRAAAKRDRDMTYEDTDYAAGEYQGFYGAMQEVLSLMTRMDSASREEAP